MDKLNADVPRVNTINFEDWFTTLDNLLSHNRHWWQIQPFHHRQLAWQHHAPELCQALQQLSDSDVALLDEDDQVLSEWLSPWISDSVQLHALSQLPELPRETSHTAGTLRAGNSRSQVAANFSL